MSLARPIHYETHRSQTNPPPQMTASNNPQPPAPYSFDAARNSSLNRASPPASYGTAPLPKAMVQALSQTNSPSRPVSRPSTSTILRATPNASPILSHAAASSCIPVTASTVHLQLWRQQRASWLRAGVATGKQHVHLLSHRRRG
jgi:hypothetical protein